MGQESSPFGMFARAGLGAVLAGLWDARGVGAAGVARGASEAAAGGLVDGDDPPFSPPLDSLVGISIHSVSGKFLVYSEALGESDPYSVSVTMQYLQEVDTQGNPVGTAESEKHSIDSFASQAFAIAGPEPISEPIASRISLSTGIGPAVGNLTVETLVLQSDGQAVGPVGGQWTAMAGDLKWNIVLDSWTFCDPCQNGQQEEVGAYIDLAVEVKTNASRVPALGEGPANLTQTLGGGIDLELTQRVTIDGVDVEMPAGYPKDQSNGDRRWFIFRFPKFNSSAVYDPLIRTSGSASLAPPSPAPSPPGIRWHTVGWIVFGVLGTVAGLVALLLFCVPAPLDQEEEQQQEFGRALSSEGANPTSSLEIMPYI